MKKTVENGIILIKKGKMKKVNLPTHGQVVIRIQDGVPVKVESILSSELFEELEDIKI